METPTPDRIRDRFTLIVGEVNSGKTTLTRDLLHEVARHESGPLVVVDLAPQIPPDLARRIGRPGIGGRLQTPSAPHVHVLTTELHAPRLTGRDDEEKAALARENARRIEPLFVQALDLKPTHLFVNDASLYLQGGSPLRLLDWLSRVETRVVNGYFGTSLGEDALSKRERSAMWTLMLHCDHLIFLEKHSKED
ncbi:hypothetical protein SAMN02745206_02751 [Desulfacinum infernum DSM 9756]|uniref:AAA+ ATPase domain-containing protein n=1 Tax=Desulfacinum infernum DSM 9756 TaxID=1121391 RepID=A0A1M5EYA9_9BACT|nr:hypothetical protein [Desulfacinum infernum]SHF83971.1 hypothetical protein SAMN02745206_02751 [Desulfacinum infernum DSM 9756]